jgi:hypothetical protein
VLLFQPDDIAIQEHFLKEAHPTKTQARTVAEGLYAWSDEGKDVSVRDLAMSLALPERRVRVVLSVLEAMGVAKEIKAARWTGVEPRPTREAIDKAARVFESRRISDRRRLAELLKYMNLQQCRVRMMRAYFGEEEGEPCGLCDSCAGLDSEVFDPGDADARHGLHAATDFHSRSRRRRRRGEKVPATVQKRFLTTIPDLLPATLPPPWIPPPDSDSIIDPSIWEGTVHPTVDIPGEIMVEPETRAAWLTESLPTTTSDGIDFSPQWLAIRDANIRPFSEWVVPQPVSLPVINSKGGQRKNSPQGNQRPPGQPNGGNPRDRIEGKDGGNQRRRRGRFDRYRPQPKPDVRGPRLPGVYNPGGE